MSFRKLVVSLASLLLVLVGNQACRRSGNEGASTKVGGPAMASSQGPFTARSGRIYTDKLFWGLLLLEDSGGHAVSPEQASGILEVLDKLERKLTKNEYYDEMLEKTLRPDQMAFLETTVGKLTEEQLHATVDPQHMAEVKQALVRVAGTDPPPDDIDISLPEGVVVRPRPLRVSRMMAFMVSFEPLMARPELAITAEQAQTLLPTVFSYVNLKNMHQQTKRDILGILREDQKAWIDGNVIGRTDSLLDMTALQSQVRDLMTQRAAGRSGTQAPLGGPGQEGADAAR